MIKIIPLTKEQQAFNDYKNGWNVNGEWQCPQCGLMIGKNLLGDRPWLLAREHAREHYGLVEK